MQVFVNKQVSENHVVPFGIPMVPRWYPGGSRVVPFVLLLVPFGIPVVPF